MKRLALLASAIVIGTAGAAHAETVTERVVYDTPQISPLQAFTKMDLDNNWIVDTIEYDWAFDHYPEVRGYSFSGLDVNSNGVITRSEAKKVSPQAAASQKTVVKTVVKDPVVVERRVDAQSGMHHDMNNGMMHNDMNDGTMRTRTNSSSTTTHTRTTY